MACDYCLGDPDGCPVCGGKPLVPCPDCEDGYRYYIIDPDTEDRHECSREEYFNAAEEYREYETCPTCEGNIFL